MASLFKEKGKFIPDSLIADNDYPLLTTGITLAAEQGILKRGTIIGMVAGEGYLTGTAIPPEDPSDEEIIAGVEGILTDDVDTDADDGLIATLYTTGVFNEEALIIHEEADLKDYKRELRTLGIFMKKVQWYNKEV